jgi:hypothetical protein
VGLTQNEQTVDNRIVALPHTIVFGTGRNMPVPIDVVVHKQQPDLTALIAAADHAVLGGITCGSGQLKVLGCTDYLPDAFTLPTLAGVPLHEAASRTPVIVLRSSSSRFRRRLQSDHRIGNRHGYPARPQEQDNGRLPFHRACGR